MINGGEGTDTLVIVDLDTSGSTIPATLNVSNVEALTARGAGALTVDVATTALDDVVTTQSTAATVTANAASDVSISAATGNVIVDGGKDVTVIGSTAAKNTTVGGTTAPKGAVSINDSNLSTGLVSVDGGTSASVTVAGTTIAAADNYDVSGGTTNDAKAAILVGESTAVGGAITLSSTGAKVTAGTNATLGNIVGTAKGDITVTQKAYSANTATATDTTGATITQGKVELVGGTSTTSVTINQDPTTAEKVYVKGVAAKANTTKVTFAALAAGENVTLVGGTNDSMTFTAAKALTALEVAQAFANLAKNATEGDASAAQGAYTNGSAGSIGNGFTSGEATAGATAASATVTFSVAESSSTPTLATTGSTTGKASAATAVAGTAAVTAVTGVTGIAAGVVEVDAGSATTVEVNGFETGSTLTANKLETLTLKNSDEDMTVTTTSVGAVTVNLDAVAGATALLSLDGTAATVTGLTINALSKSDVAVTADAATSVTIDAAGSLDLSSSSFNAAKTVTITGAGAVTFDEDGGNNAVTSVDASGNTGGVTMAQELGTAATFTGGEGKDSVKLAASTKASTLGAGDDTATLSVAALGTGGTVDAGDGTDTLVLTVANAVTATASTTAGDALKADALNFERLELGVAPANSTAGTQDTRTIDLDKIGYSYVTSSGTTADGTTAANASVLAFTGAAANSTFVLQAAAAGENTYHTVALKTATGTSDVVTVAPVVAAADVNYGQFTATAIETVNVSVSDISTTAAVNTATLKVTATAATTINVSGNGHLTLDGDSTSALTAVNASDATGNLKYTADGAAAGTTVTGGAGKDTLTGSGSNDVLIGGAGDDSLTASSLTTLTGGEGSDTFVMPAAVSSTVYSTITDLSSGDVVDTGAAATFSSAKITLSSNSTFTQYLDAAVAANDATSAGFVEWFQFGGNTYLVRDNDDGASTPGDTTGYTAAEDSVIEITGLVDLSTATFNATTGDLTI